MGLARLGLAVLLAAVAGTQVAARCGIVAPRQGPRSGLRYTLAEATPCAEFLRPFPRRPRRVAAAAHALRESNTRSFEGAGESH